MGDHLSRMQNSTKLINKLMDKRERLGRETGSDFLVVLPIVVSLSLVF